MATSMATTTVRAQGARGVTPATGARRVRRVAPVRRTVEVRRATRAMGEARRGEANDAMGDEDAIDSDRAICGGGARVNERARRDAR